MRVRAARAALGFVEASEEVSAGRPDWPRFRVGVNSGPAVIGNVGAAEQRSFTAIGDTTNLAARLQSAAEPGRVVVGSATAAALAGAILEPLGAAGAQGKERARTGFSARPARLVSGVARKERDA